MIEFENNYEMIEEEIVEDLILKCKLNRNDAYEVCKNRFFPDYKANYDLYKHCSCSKIAKGFVENYIDEYC